MLFSAAVKVYLGRVGMKVKLGMFERFWFNDLIADEAKNVQAHVVCTKCSNKYDMGTDGVGPLPTPAKDNEYWYVWMLDHPADVLIAWMVGHLRDHCVNKIAP